MAADGAADAEASGVTAVGIVSGAWFGDLVFLDLRERFIRGNGFFLLQADGFFFAVPLCYIFQAEGFLTR